MSWSRLVILALTAALVAGCGFRPLYSARERESTVDRMAVTKINLIADRIGQELHNELLNHINPLGRPTDPRYALNVELSESQERLAIRKDDVATRANLNLVAQFELVDLESGEAVYRGSSKSTSSFDVLVSTFATLSAENAARRRALRLIGEDIHLRLGLFFNRAPDGAS